MGKNRIVNSDNRVKATKEPPLYRTLAQELGLSEQMIVRAIKGSERVSKKIRDRVIRAAKNRLGGYANREVLDAYANFDPAKYVFIPAKQDCPRFGKGFVFGDPTCEVCEFKSLNRWRQCRWRQLAALEERPSVHGRGQDHRFIQIDWVPPTVEDYRAWLETFRTGTLARAALEHLITNGLITTLTALNDHFKGLQERYMGYGFKHREDFRFTIANYCYEWSKQFRFCFPFTARRYLEVIGLYKAKR